MPDINLPLINPAAGILGSGGGLQGILGSPASSSFLANLPQTIMEMKRQAMLSKVYKMQIAEEQNKLDDQTLEMISQRAMQDSSAASDPKMVAAMRRIYQKRGVQNAPVKQDADGKWSIDTQALQTERTQQMLQKNPDLIFKLAAAPQQERQALATQLGLGTLNPAFGSAQPWQQLTGGALSKLMGMPMDIMKQVETGNLDPGNAASMLASYGPQMAALGLDSSALANVIPKMGALAQAKLDNYKKLGLLRDSEIKDNGARYQLLLSQNKFEEARVTYQNLVNQVTPEMLQARIHQLNASTANDYASAKQKLAQADNIVNTGTMKATTALLDNAVNSAQHYYSSKQAIVGVLEGQIQQLQTNPNLSPTQQMQLQQLQKDLQSAKNDASSAQTLLQHADNVQTYAGARIAFTTEFKNDAAKLAAPIRNFVSMHPDRAGVYRNSDTLLQAYVYGNQADRDQIAGELQKAGAEPLVNWMRNYIPPITDTTSFMRPSVTAPPQ